MTTVKCASEFRCDGEQLVADRALADFIVDLPADAVLSPITVERGNQRDPWQVMVGIRAVWEEVR